MQYPIIDLITSAYINNGWTGLNISTGKNLVNQDNIIVGTYVDGVFEENINYRCSELIEVESNTSYYSSLFDRQFVRIAGLVWNEFDENNVFLGQKTTNPIVTQNNTKYIAVRNFDSSRPYILADDYLYQVEKGTQATSYEPYSQPKNDFQNRLKLPLPHYFPHPVIDSLKRASDGTMTNKDREILTHYLTPLGIGGI